VIAANFKVDEDTLKPLPSHEKYIFNGSVPGPIDTVKKPGTPMQTPLTLHMKDVPAKEFEAGKVWIVDQSVFPAAKTISAAIVEVQPGGMREMHWHPKSEEWDYYIQGQAKVGVFNSNTLARTFNFNAGDVGVIPKEAGHYIQNIGDEPLIFIELFKNPVYSDVSLNKWLAISPTQMVADHLNLPTSTIENFPTEEAAVVWYDDPRGHVAHQPVVDPETFSANDVFGK